jgi:hypothetical protein
MTDYANVFDVLQRIADRLDAIDGSLMLIVATVSGLNTRDSVRNPA